MGVTLYRCIKLSPEVGLDAAFGTKKTVDFQRLK